MKKIYLILFSFIILNANQIEKILISTNSNITIPKITNKYLEKYSFSTKDKRINPFYISKYEITIAQYKQYLKFINKKEDIISNIDDEPISNVDFDTAQNVCRFYKGRLPTEFEWIVTSSIKIAKSKCYENLAIGSFYKYSTKNYPLNENDNHIKCMLKDDDELEIDLIGSELLEVQDSYENINGTYGMLGNLWEWVDTKQEKVYFNQSYKVIKGGSFANFNQKELFDNRISNFIKKETKMSNIGFRCVWDKNKR